MTKLFLALSLIACTPEPGDDDTGCTGGKCDGSSVDQTCSDPRYGDGTCDLTLTCGVPDIDCFRTFATDAEAAAWWTQEEQINMMPFPVLPETDPRFARIRGALDAGWDAFKHHRPVGELASARPALVLVDQPLAHAAFVYGDSAHDDQPFAVMVETAAIDLGAGDDAVLAVMLHELQHAVGLHLLGDRIETIRKFYAAPGLGEQEPMGRDQADDADVRTVALAWIDAATQIGPYSQTELGGLPLAGELASMLATVDTLALQAHPDLCSAPVATITELSNELAGAQSLLDGALPALPEGADAQIAQALATLRDDCLAQFPYDLIDVGAQTLMVTSAEFEAQLAPRDVALVKGKHFIDGLAALTLDRRATMRTAEDLFAEAKGVPWTDARYFSHEEDADDVSGIVMAAAGKDPTKLGEFFATVQAAPARAACEATAAPGYGVDLTDAHHAVCWRIAHNQRQSDDRRAVKPAAGRIELARPGKWPTRQPAYRIAD